MDRKVILRLDSLDDHPCPSVVILLRRTDHAEYIYVVTIRCPENSMTEEPGLCVEVSVWNIRNAFGVGFSQEPCVPVEPVVPRVSCWATKSIAVLGPVGYFFKCLCNTNPLRELDLEQRSGSWRAPLLDVQAPVVKVLELFHL